MRMLWSKRVLGILLIMVTTGATVFAREPITSDFDRITVVAHQVDLLKKRNEQSELAFLKMQTEQRALSPEFYFNKASKPYLDKASLDMAVAASNLEGIDIELADAKQMIYWLEKNVQEIENQINLMGMFNLKNAAYKKTDMKSLSLDLNYQRRLLRMEKKRYVYLAALQSNLQGILQVKKENFQAIKEALKSNKLLQLKQKEVRDELDYQEQQQRWLANVNELYAQLAELDPAKHQARTVELEREIFYANEKSNYAYTRSLLARYNDQLQQMRMAFVKGSSITLFSEISSQMTTLKKQIERIEDLLRTRVKVVRDHLSLLTNHPVSSGPLFDYQEKLSVLASDYEKLNARFDALQNNLAQYRDKVDHALQKELSARQGLPTFGVKMVLDVGRELYLVPALAFQISKTISAHVLTAVETASGVTWLIFGLAQSAIIFFFMGLRRFVNHMLSGHADWHEKFNAKWLILQIIKRHFVAIFLVADGFSIFMMLSLPVQGFGFVFSLALVFLVASGLMTLSRLSLVETTHDSTGHDMRLFKRMRWIIWTGGIITAFTVLVHQLPLAYELKLLCDRLFLLSLMLASLMVLRSWHVVPHLIVSHMETPHPYIETCVKTICILVPALIFFNSLAGLLGYMNLVMTLSRYEGIFILVLLGYIVLRGLLSDLMLQASRLIISHANNGWLLTEAFLKPLDKILHVTLFLSAWAMLFLLYGWDKESPIVVRLDKLLHLKLVNILGTTITPINIIALFVVTSVFYWTAKWTREFVYRALSSRTADMGVRNSIAILSQYSVIIAGIFIALRVLGIDLSALAFISGMFAFGVGLGLRDLANNFATGFFLLIERPVRVGDLVEINGAEGEVIHIGSRAITVRTWDHVDMLVPNTEIFNKAFTNWTARDDVVRSVLQIKISRHDNPHQVMAIIEQVLLTVHEVLREPATNVFLKDLSDTLMEFEVRYYINIRQAHSRLAVKSKVLMAVWDNFQKMGIKPPFPQSEIYIRSDASKRLAPLPELLEPQ